MSFLDLVHRPNLFSSIRSRSSRLSGVLKGHLRLEPLEDRATPAVLIVNSLLDNQIPGDGLVTLREAILAHRTFGLTDLGTRADGTNDTIDLTALQGTIVLTQGELQVTSFTGFPRSASLDLLGPAADRLTISGNNSSRVFNNDFSSILRIRDLTIADGNTTDQVGGAGILNDGTLILERSVVQNSTYQGGITAFGGGVYSRSGSDLTLIQSLISNNSGGAGSVLLGGGIASFGTLDMQNSTLTGNTGNDAGGGLYVGAGSVSLLNNTIVDNRVNATTVSNPSGGGIFFPTAVTPLLRNNIVARNLGSGGSPDDISGIVDPVSANNFVGIDTNLTGITNGSNGNFVGSSGAALDPLLASLGNYGGATATFAALPGSPVLDSGGSFGLTIDQRGVTRNTRTDIGAFESSGFRLAPEPGSTPQTTVASQPFPNPIALRIIANNPLEPVAGGFVNAVISTTTAPPGGSIPPNAPIDANGLATFPGFTLFEPGTYEVLVSVDQTSPPAQFSLNNLRVLTTISLAPNSTNPTFLGNPVSLLASAMGENGSPVSGGQINIFFDETFLGSILVDNPTPIDVPQSLLTIGDHEIKSVYSPDSESVIPGSEQALTLTVLGAMTETSIALDPPVADPGQSVRIFGTVTSAAATTSPPGSGTGGPTSPSTPTGTVTLILDGIEVASVSLVGQNYEFIINDLDVGDHLVQVRYNGDATNAFSLSEPLTVIVTSPPVVEPPNPDNMPPILSPIPDQVAREGLENLFELGGFADPDSAGPFLVVVDWGDGTDPTTFQVDSPGELGSQPHTYFEAGTYTVSVFVIDGLDVSEAETFTAFVVQGAPRDLDPDLPIIDPPDLVLDGFFDFGDFLDEASPFEEDEFGLDEFEAVELPNLTDLQEAVMGLDDEGLPENETPAIEFRGAELIRLELPRFGPPIMSSRPDGVPAPSATAPPANVPVSTRMGEKPPPSSPLNERSPLGTPINLFNSVFDSDDSVDLIDSLRRELKNPKRPPSPPPSGGGTNPPLSMLAPIATEADLPEEPTGSIAPFLAVTLGAMWTGGSRKDPPRRRRMSVHEVE